MPSTRTNSTIVGIRVSTARRDNSSMPFAAPLQHAGQPAGLALQVEAQGQPVHVLEGLQRELAHRVHGDLGEEAVAHLGEHRHQDAGGRRRAP
jgi:hypothetical protein